MTDDIGWNDFGVYSGGGAALGHPTPNIDRIGREGAVFTNWYGQASCTAGRASFITGRIPIRSALLIVVVPGDENALRKETPTIAEFFKRNGYSTYFSGKWRLGDKPESYPIERGFDEMKAFAAYYPGVYTYSDTSKWFPSYNPEFSRTYFEVVNMFECQNLHMLDESVQVHAMHIPIKQPDLLAPQANPLKVQEDHEAGERIVDDLSQNGGRAHIAGSKLCDGSSESVRSFEHLPTLSPLNVKAWSQASSAIPPTNHAPSRKALVELRV